jgi:DNA/RNA endonuclease YhcR with UshA esterase domain
MKNEDQKLIRYMIRVVVTAIAILTVAFFIKKWYFSSVSKAESFVSNKSSLTEKYEKPVSIKAEEAASNIGKFAEVSGKITDTYMSKSACFLKFKSGYQTFFTVVIFKSDFEKFDKKPEEYYLNKSVIVKGRIKDYEGLPEIILKSPEQIIIK